MAKGSNNTPRTRKAKIESGTERCLKDKFYDQRRNLPKLTPWNDLQAEYIRNIESLPLNIATGFAGTSKTYIPTVIACDKLLLGDIDTIYLSRPAVSNSKSLGYFSGSVIEKASAWLGPVINTMRDRLGDGNLEYLISKEIIKFIPLEVIKGYSFENCFVLIDEAEDLTYDEAKKVVTRIGENCTMVLAGDVTQSELKEKSGLKMLKEVAEKNPTLFCVTGVIDFNRPSDIVRSQTCKEWILAFRREEEEK